jgi:hypothetical protein
VLSQGSTAAARTLLTVTPAPSLTSTGAPDPEFAPHSVPLTTQLTTPAASSPPPTPPPSLPPGPVPAADEPILALGDSVLLAATPALTDTFGPAITVDADVGRQVDAGLARLGAYKKTGALARYRTVMIVLGTNGAFSPGQFGQLAALLAGVPHVVVYTVHEDRPWAAPTNAAIAHGVAAHPAQMKMADWNLVATPPLLYSDGVHPNLDGAAAFTHLLIKALIGH